MAFNTKYLDIMSEHVDFPVHSAPVSLESVFGDGESYSDGLFFQSPEGNFYGQTMVVREYYVPIIWDGEQYVHAKPLIDAASINDLPSTGSRHFEQARVPRISPTREDLEKGYTHDIYAWDTVSQSWLLVEWLWNIDKPSEVPYPGLGVGKGHIFIQYNQMMIWDGKKWKPYPPHSNLVDDEPDRHLTRGFITNYEDYQTNTNGAIQFLQSQQAEARLEFLSKTNLGLLSSVSGKTGALWVNNELLLTDDVSNVENTDDVLLYSEGTATTDSVEAETEYYVYCGNSDFAPCPGGLFLSKTPDINGRLGDEEPGVNARIVGIVETDSAGYFIREIDQSYIGKKVEFSQTFWEYSDYQLQFVDEDNLAFNRIDGTHGLFYINGQLLYLGTGKDLNRADYRIEWQAGPDVDTSDISAETTYQIYIANDSVEFNFNNEDSETGLPYEEGHPSYISSLDFRRQLFLSTQPHDHRVFNQEYPGYYARHIGQVQTDENGYFKYAADISLIRQPTLNPTHLDGLAEIAIEYVSDSQFKIIRKKGTTGLVFVGGKPTQTYSSDDPRVHIIRTSDSIYTYDEGNISSPLTFTGAQLASKVGFPVYLYMANSASYWGGLVNGVFLSTQTPTGGYLSSNWPGNNARWLLTLNLSPLDKGAELVANGTFATDASWTWGSGWTHNSVDQLAAHSSGTTALSQSISVTTSDYCYVTFSTSGIDTGSVTFKLGNTESSLVSTSGSNVFYMFPTSGTSIQFVPTTDFDGNIDNVSVKKITSGNFAGNFITDAITGVNTVIDDGIVSADKTWSSLRIQREISRAITMMTASVGFDNQKTFGLPLRLEYSSSTQARLYPVGTDRPIIAFPNLTTREIPNAGIYLDIDGDPLTLYYVYLSETSLIMSTLAPDTTYAKMKTRGEEYVLVGYAGCSATDTIAGNWNIFSLYGEPSREWTVNITSSSPTTLNIPGIVLPPNKTATIERTGSSRFFQGSRCTYSSGYYSWSRASIVIGSNSYSSVQSVIGEPYYCCYSGVVNSDPARSCGGTSVYASPCGGEGEGYIPGASYSVLINGNTTYPVYSNGVFAGVLTVTHNLACTPSIHAHGGWYHVTEGCYWDSITGQLKVSRPAGDW